MENIEIKYSIKHLLIAVLSNSVFLGAGFYLLVILNWEDFQKFKSSDYLMLIISVLFIFIFGKNIIEEFLNVNKKIVFSKNGIDHNNFLYNGNYIKQIHIESKKLGKSDISLKDEENYLAFKYKNETVEIKIDDYQTTVDEIKTIINDCQKTWAPKKQNHVETKFDGIIDLDKFYELDEKIMENSIKQTQALCKDNVEDLKTFCINNLFTDIDKISYIYVCLSDSEDTYWNEFLESEFIRVYKIALAENKAQELFPVLDSISVENIKSLKSDEIRKILSNELENQNLSIKFNTLQLLQYWIDRDILLKNQFLLSKLKQKLKDENWKIRWHANRILTVNNIEIEKIGFLDAIRGKISKPYSI